MKRNTERATRQTPSWTPEQDTSPYFHSTDKGCKLFDIGYYRGKGKKKSYLPRKNCNTHDVITCHDGWQIGYHQNEKAQDLNLLIRLNPKPPRLNL